MLARILFGEVLDAEAATLGASHPGTWKSLCGRLHESTDSELDEPSSCGVDDFLDDVVDNLATVRPRNAKAAAACKRVVHDARRMAAEHRRAPFDPLLRDFETARDAAVDFYALAGIAVPTGLSDGLRLEVLCAETPQHGMNLEYVTSGAAVLYASGPRARIELTLVPRQLDWNSCLSVPYVLMHELVSHAFVGPWDPETRARDSAWPTFAEGWMDVIAHQVLAAALAPSGPLSAYGARFRYEMERERVARRYHDARFSSASSGEHLQRQLGRTALDRLFAVLKRRPESRSDPQLALWRFSAALNTSAMPQLERHELMYALVHKLAPNRLHLGAPLEREVGSWADRAAAAGSNEEAWDAALKLCDAIAD
jgi:hypothetical protein